MTLLIRRHRREALIERDEEAEADAVRRRLWRPAEGLWYPTVEEQFLWPSVQAENGHMALPREEWSHGTLVIGDKGTGKCIAADELVLLDGTLVRAEEAWARYATAASYDGEGWWSSPVAQPLTCALDEQSGRIVTAPVVRFYRQRVRETGRRVRLSDGSELTFTRRHRLRGAEEWTNELAVGDVVCAPRRITYPGRKADLALAELLAWQVALGCEGRDGTDSSRGSGRVTITHANRAVVERLRELTLSAGRRYSLKVNAPWIDDRPITPVLVIDSAGWRDYLIGRGYQWGRTGADRQLPDFIMQGDLETARVVLRAFADAEGRVSARRRAVEMKTASRVLGEQLRHLLRRFGILASFRLEPAAASNGANVTGDCGRLVIGGEGARVFSAEIGFSDPRKQERLRQVALEDIASSSNLEGIYTQDVLLELEALGTPIAWLGITDGRFGTDRIARGRVRSLVDAIRSAADRLDCGQFAAPRAGDAAVLGGRAATLAAIDARRVRALADRLERRIGEEVLHVTVERIDEVELDGWVYDFEVAEHHNYLAGGMLAHNSAILARHYLNAIQDPDGAVILIDPKRTLALRALALTPFRCGKRLWYLDLSRPAFGMSPLRIGASKQAIANVVVAALRDVFPEQLFQASREVIEKCVLAALALAEAEARPPRIEDVFNLMVWENQPLRERAIAASSRIPNGDRVRDYLTVELAGDMRENTAHTRDRLRAPRNKLDALLQAESLRIFFNHTTEKPLEEIVRDRDILIVDANLGAGGEENSELMIAFILHMLDSVLKRQQGLDEREIAKVHLFIDEGGHVLNPHILRMQDSHREAGLTLTVAMHYLAQLDPGVLSGVLNMLANKMIFRIGSHRDATELRDNVRAAVYRSLPDPDEERLWPEVLQELANLRCIASWMHEGRPLDPFIGSPYPMPPVSAAGWRPQWLDWLAGQVGDYPEHLLWTLREEQQREAIPAANAAAPVEAAGSAAAAPRNAREENTDAAVTRRSAGDGRQVARLDRARQLAAAAKLDVSLARMEVAGFSSLGIDPEELRQRGVRAPSAIAELAAIDRIAYRVKEPLEDEQGEPLPRLTDNDLDALATLDRLGFMTAEQLGRCCWPNTALNNAQKRLRKLAVAGLVHRYPLQLQDQRGGRSSYLYALTPKGLHTAQHPPRGRAPTIAERRRHRPSEAISGSDLRHDLIAANWLISFLRAFPRATTNNWRTPRYHSGHLDVPTVPAGRRGERRPITMIDAEAALHEYYCFADVRPPENVIPDLSIELRLTHHDPDDPAHNGETITTDLLVEIDNTGRPDRNAAKFRHYDSLLCGWSLLTSRYQALHTRPFCLFVAADINAMDRLMRCADKEMTGAVGVKGMSNPAAWYQAGRDHIAFTFTELIHYGLPTAWMLPPHPPEVRRQLGDLDGYRITPVSLLDPRLIAKESMVGWELRAGNAIPASHEDPGSGR